MSSPVSTSTITATTLLTLMCVDASVSKNQSEYAHVLGSAWLFFSSGPNRVAHSRRTSMSICSRSNRLPSALSANSGSGDLQYWRPSLYEFSRCFCIIFCFMLSNLPLETFRPSRRCRASPCSWVRYWNTSSAADSSIWPSSSVINSTSSCIESNCVRVMAAPSGRAADSPPPRRFRGDEVEYGGDIMQIRGEALRVEQGLAEVTGHHYLGMLAVGGTSGIRIGLRPRRHR